MIDLSGSGKIEGPHLEGYEFDPQKYIQPENPYFEAKLYKNRPNELVRILNAVSLSITHNYYMFLLFTSFLLIAACSSKCLQRFFPYFSRRDHPFTLPMLQT